jgi:hypothetical protein
MTKEEGAKLLAERCEQLRKLFDECVAISDASGMDFTLPWGGEGTYEAGIGGVYVPTDDRWFDKKGWNPSAYSC